MPESVETLLAEALVSRNHIPIPLELNAEKEKLLANLLNGLTFPGLKTTRGRGWSVFERRRVAEGFAQRLMKFALSTSRRQSIGTVTRRRCKLS